MTQRLPHAIPSLPSWPGAFWLLLLVCVHGCGIMPSDCADLCDRECKVASDCDPDCETKCEARQPQEICS